MRANRLSRCCTQARNAAVPQRQWLFFAPFLLLFLFACKGRPPGPPANLMHAVDSLRQAYCPDRRLSVFDVSVKPGDRGFVLQGEVDDPAAAAAVHDLAGEFRIEVDLRLLPDLPPGIDTTAIVNSAVANMRSEPRYSAELVNQILLGHRLRLLKNEDGWFYVQSEDGYLGWMNRSFFVIADSIVQARWQDLHVFTQVDGEIFAQRGGRGLCVSRLPRGAFVAVKNRQANWAQVFLPDGRIGYLPGAHLQPLAAWRARRTKRGRDIVQTAMQFHGVPYLWGGTSPAAFDCSGFTQTVFRWNGIQLLRDASQQFRQGAPVTPGTNFENLRPGDLLFFGPRPGKITHVGIYIGESRFIHSSGRVKINSLDSTAADFNAYRFKTFRGARRVIQ